MALARERGRRVLRRSDRGARVVRARGQESEARGARETREMSERGRAMDTESGSCKGSARADLTTASPYDGASHLHS